MPNEQDARTRGLILSTVGGGVSLAPDAPSRQRAICEALDAVLATHVRTPEQQAKAVLACQHGLALIKEVEKVGQIIRKPVRDIAANILDIETRFNRPIENKIKLVKLELKEFNDREEIRVAEEERQKAETLRRLQAEEEALKQEAITVEATLPATEAVAEITHPVEYQKAIDLRNQAEDVAVEAISVAMMPTPAVAKPQGLINKKPWRYEVTDAAAAYADHPSYFTLVENKLAIKADLGENFQCAGIRCWQETDIQIRQS
jgi:hypothetical protein